MIGDLEIVRATGQAVVEVVKDAGATAALYSFGKKQIDTIRSFVGEQQESNLRKIWQKTRNKLVGVTENRLSEPSASVITPLIEAAIQEQRDELQELWAGLLANALIDNSSKVRRDIIEVVRKLEPTDVKVLKIIQRPLASVDPFRINARAVFNQAQFDELGISSDDFFVSKGALVQLGCLSEGNGGLDPSLTPFARRLIAACEV